MWTRRWVPRVRWWARVGGRQSKPRRRNPELREGEFRAEQARPAAPSALHARSVAADHDRWEWLCASSRRSAVSRRGAKPLPHLTFAAARQQRCIDRSVSQRQRIRSADKDRRHNAANSRRRGARRCSIRAGGGCVMAPGRTRWRLSAAGRTWPGATRGRRRSSCAPSLSRSGRPRAGSSSSAICFRRRRRRRRARRAAKV